MSHDYLRKVAMQFLKASKWSNATTSYHGFGCTIVLSEIVSASGNIPDAIGWRYGRSVLIECKVSRSDFLVDAKKPHRIIGTGPGEERYYMTPKGMLSTEEIPEGWGLLEVEGKTVAKVKNCLSRMLDIEGQRHEKIMLLSTIRRIRTREFLIVSPCEMDELLSLEPKLSTEEGE